MAILNTMPISDINFNIAHELAHAFLHYDKGDITSDNNAEYEEQANRAATMLLEALEVA